MTKIRTQVNSVGSVMTELSGMMEIFCIMVGVRMNFSVCVFQNTLNGGFKICAFYPVNIRSTRIRVVYSIS